MERAIGFQIEDLAFPLSFPRSDYTVSNLPIPAGNQQWTADGIAWLAETCDIGGINIDSGDYGVCGCDACGARRAAREDAGRRGEFAESWSHADMADLYPRLFQAARSRAQRDDLWLYSSCNGTTCSTRRRTRRCGHFPARASISTLNRSYWNLVKERLSPVYVKRFRPRRTSFAQFASQWNGSRATDCYKFNGRDFAELAWKAAECGLEGLAVPGEASAFHAATELSYLAFARFTYDPSLTWGSVRPRRDRTASRR